MTEAAELIARLRDFGNITYESDIFTDKTICTEAADHIETLEARVATLSAALEPFADIAKDVAQNHPGWDHDAFEFALLSYTITLAPFRAAREASR